MTLSLTDKTIAYVVEDLIEKDRKLAEDLLAELEWQLADSKDKEEANDTTK